MKKFVATFWGASNFHGWPNSPAMDLRLVQTNLNQCRDVQDLFWEFVDTKGISVALVSEPYDVGCSGWRCDSSGRASIGILRDGPSLGDVEVSDGYVAATVDRALRIYSYYASPELSLPEFEQFLTNLEVNVAASELTRSSQATSTPGPRSRAITSLTEEVVTFTR